MKTFLALFAMLAATGAASAGDTGDIGYSGNWPATVTHGRLANGTYCLALTDDGSVRWTHSGHLSLTTPSGDKLTYGTFQLIDGLLTATVETDSDTGQNAGLVFVARAQDGTIGKGTFDDVYGGEEVESGAVAFGPKGGC